ncbi:MAG: Crp/Fnr family transcriptional regulator [Gammaproteobacteria bacterium]|nr:Crp/Fnr family transcriptional regulator [Gammaproteobacteria bacterium]
MAAVDIKPALQDIPKIITHGKDTITPVNAEKKTTESKVTKFLFSYGRKQQFSKGQYIIREGHMDKTVFIILKGEVEILKKDENGIDKVVTKLNGGGIILGEMSIFLDEPRSSSVRIAKDSLALEFTGENFLNAVVNIPELSMRILKSLSNKLKSTNERVVQNTLTAKQTKNPSPADKPAADQNPLPVAVDTVPSPQTAEEPAQ